MDTHKDPALEHAGPLANPSRLQVPILRHRRWCVKP